MRKIQILAMALALAASLPAHTSAEESAFAVCAPAQETSSPIEITSYENRIKVSNAPVGSLLEIYSVVGIKVKEIRIKQPTAEYEVNIAKGYYIIRVNDTVRKVAIR